MCMDPEMGTDTNMDTVTDMDTVRTEHGNGHGHGTDMDMDNQVPTRTWISSLDMGT